MGVEKQLQRLPGVKQVDADYATASATVTYDEAQTDLKRIKYAVRECAPRRSGTVDSGDRRTHRKGVSTLFTL